ncbi:uncharacterized protein LOC122511938 [Leptopilina heterotoma]|uniref:uncharacterized protein LOC122511938 n=1 Tax=Leptopilina heterotoma TaxID=63436 RepID=UPI001CA8E7BE|nr:uncharacterized protein LOC122511938 [Leptopilina heterotoma]
MTMEERSCGLERESPVISTTTILSSNSFSDDAPVDTSNSIQKVNKRSFDVAFLVAPDENLSRRQSEKLSVVCVNKLTDMTNDYFRNSKITTRHDSEGQEKSSQKQTKKQSENHKKRLYQYPEDCFSCSYISSKTVTPILSRISSEQSAEHYIHNRSQKCHTSPNLSQDSQNLLGRYVDIIEPIGLTRSTSCSEGIGESKSAFTKVSLTSRSAFDDEQTSPRSSISPDGASYQSSISPPVIPLSGSSNFKCCSLPTKITYPFLMGPETQKSNLLDNLKISQTPKIHNQMYPSLPYNPISVFPQISDTLSRPRFLTTTNSVTGLLPASLAALTLPAQNVCAKCNLSFRMTSDLVYHMRSHHKNETAGESSRRRREEKLRCPVCDESFRERHHLTRHMTAHQDKESDAIVDQVEVKRRSVPIHGK